MDRYYGIFHINMEIIEQAPNKLMRDIFSKMIIIRAEHLLADNVIEYVAYSPELFQLVKIGSIIPRYRCVMDENIKMVQII